MNGIININKEKDITSFDVIRKLRKILKTRKIGHTGTLDPLATGVLVMCVGGATKLASEIEAESKTYLANLDFGYATDTLDVTGKVLETKEKIEVTKELFEASLKRFVGDIEQVPPMYSALKVQGKKLYELAREGKEIERLARPVHISYIELIEFNEKSAVIKCKVSKGTYIRTLIDDIGRDLDCLATMTNLERLAVGEYNIENSYEVEEIEKMVENNNLEFIKDVEESFSYEKIQINDVKLEKLLRNGNKIPIENITSGIKKIYIDGKFWGLAKVEGSILKPHKYFNIF